MAFQDAWNKISREFSSYAPEVIAGNSGAAYHAEKATFKLKYCGNFYFITYPDGKIDEGENYLTSEERILFLQYLCRSRRVPPRRQWISFWELPGGPHHFAPFQRDAIFPLAKEYGYKLAKFKEQGEKYGEEIEAGDAAFAVTVFPRLEIAVILWEGDAEFPPRANVLFDSTASFHLPTDSLYMLGIEVVRRIWH